MTNESINLDVFNEKEIEDKFVVIEYYETKKQRLERMSSEVEQLKEIMVILREITGDQDLKLETLDSTLSNIKDEIAQSELEIIMAKTLDEEYSYTKYWLTGTLLLGGTLLLKLIN